MTKATTALLLALLLAIGPGNALSSQSPTPPRTSPVPVPSPTVGEPSANDWVAVSGPHIDYESFIADSSLLASDSAMLQDQALDHLENAIRSGLTAPGDTNLITLLAAACLVPNKVVSAPNQDSKPDFPGIRARSLQLLATLGGDEARTLLIEVIEYEPDPAVLAEAYRSLRQLHVPLKPSLVPTLVRHLQDPFNNGPNDGLIQSMLLFVKENQFIGLGPAGKELFDAILGVYQNARYLQQTNDLALKTLKAIMGTN